MAPPQPKSGLFVGINKGHVVTKRELPPRPSHRKGVSRRLFIFLDHVLLMTRVERVFFCV
jgi:large subunit ribosomal protein L36e